jgi:hypothetical protein
MARRPATVTQADIARAIRAARQAGAAEVEVRVGQQARIIIRVVSSTGDAVNLDGSREIVL